jgi:hypothetical protein
VLSRVSMAVLLASIWILTGRLQGIDRRTVVLSMANTGALNGEYEQSPGWHPRHKLAGYTKRTYSLPRSQR